MASNTLAALILRLESGKFVKISPCVVSLKLKYPMIPNNRLKDSETPTEICATERQFPKVGSFKLLNTRKLLCWQTNAKLMVPIPAKIVGLMILDPDPPVSMPCLSPSRKELDMMIRTKIQSLNTDNEDVLARDDKCLRRHRGRMMNIENMLIMNSLLGRFPSSPYAFLRTIGIVSPMMTI